MAWKSYSMCRKILHSVALAVLLACGCRGTGDLRPVSELRQNFSKPSQQYGTDCWWWWLNNNVDKEAISRDLREMASKGFYGAVVIDEGVAGQAGHDDVPYGPRFGSPEWCRLFRYALDEAAEHGLVMGLNLQNGWNLGGEYVTPEFAAKHLVYTSICIDGGQTATLPQPGSHAGFYRDIAVLAFPRTGARSPRIRRLGKQCCDEELGFSTPDGRTLLCNDIGEDEGETDLVRQQDIRVLTDMMDAEGHLDWTCPEGEWTVVRIGYTCTQAKMATSSTDPTRGLVVDFLSRDAFDHFWKELVEPILKASGPHVGKTLKYLATDSWEAGGMNWTDGFDVLFREFSGYDITPWLLTVAGFVVEGEQQTLSFLADFRKTIGEAIATRHYARFAEKAHALGMGIQPEAAGPHGGPFDGIRNYGYNDIVMSEFWAQSPHRPTPARRFFVKQASSAAHIYGKKIVGAEAFTTIGPQWNDLIWRNQKPAFDREVCEGLNRVYFHTFTCSPSSMGRPGQEYFAGTHFNPNITWWDRSDGFVSYLSRIQALAQIGEPVNDILYYYGDHVPNIYPLSPEPAPGYDYDVCDEHTLLRAKVRGGRVVLPSGRSYELLVLQDSRILSPELLRHLDKLVHNGACVLGAKPEKVLTLRPSDDFTALSDKLWGDGTPGIRRHGRGRIISGMDPSDFLASNGLAPDCDAPGLFWIHYRYRDADAYFLSNQSEESLSADVRFRVDKGCAELWNAVDGTVSVLDFSRDASSSTVSLEFGPCESKLVVFVKDSGAATVPATVCGSDPIQLSGPWKVWFDPALGGPGEVCFGTLCDWTQDEDPGIRYYSGAAVYKTSFESRTSAAVMRLGDVLDVGIAGVKVNGRDLGTLWTWPFEIRLEGLNTDCENELEITVVNSWYNRVCGDMLQPDRALRTKTNIRPRNPNVLSPSGLLGPVTLRPLQ